MVPTEADVNPISHLPGCHSLCCHSCPQQSSLTCVRWTREMSYVASFQFEILRRETQFKFTATIVVSEVPWVLLHQKPHGLSCVSLWERLHHRWAGQRWLMYVQWNSEEIMIQRWFQGETEDWGRVRIKFIWSWIYFSHNAMLYFNSLLSPSTRYNVCLTSGDLGFGYHGRYPFALCQQMLPCHHQVGARLISQPSNPVSWQVYGFTEPLFQLARTP